MAGRLPDRGQVREHDETRLIGPSHEDALQDARSTVHHKHEESEEGWEHTFHTDLHDDVPVIRRLPRVLNGHRILHTPLKYPWSTISTEHTSFGHDCLFQRYG